MQSFLIIALALFCVLLSANGEVVNVQITQVITSTIAAYSGAQTAFDTTLKQTVAGTLGVTTADLSAYAVTDSSPNIQVAYTIAVNNTVNTYTQVSTQLAEEVSDGTFDNLLHIFAAANSATGLTTATAGTYTITSTVPTASPTPTPTAAPTEYSAEQFGWQVTHFWIYSVIIGSFVGAFLLYQGAWGIYYLLQWLGERQRKHVEELNVQVDKANAKLTKKFVKHIDSPSPHASRMRENFEKQFGYAPKGGGIARPKDEDGVTLTSSAGRAGSGKGSPSKGSPRGKMADHYHDPTFDESKGMDLEAGPSHGQTPPRSPVNHSNNSGLDLSAHARTPVAPPRPNGSPFGTPKVEAADTSKANRLKSNDKYGGSNRKKFGFAD